MHREIPAPARVVDPMMGCKTARVWLRLTSSRTGVKTHGAWTERSVVDECPQVFQAGDGSCFYRGL